jgi:hypothetical protein
MHIAHGWTVRDRRDYELAGIFEADEASVEETVYARRQK